MSSVTGNRTGNTAKISARVRLMNTALLVIILIIIMSLAAVMISGIVSKASGDIAFSRSLEVVGSFNSFMSRDLALVQKTAGSKALTEWFADEKDHAKKTAAYNEMKDYLNLLEDAELYFGISGSMNEFYLNRGTSLETVVPHGVMNRENPEDSWYYELAESENLYVFNMDIDKSTNEWSLWINHKVIYDRQTVGVFCSGLKIQPVFEEIFSRYKKDSVAGYVINGSGAIQFTSDPDDHSAPNETADIRDITEDDGFRGFIDSYLDKIDGYFSANSQPEVTKLSKGRYNYASAAPIANSDWTVITFFSSDSLYKTSNLLPLVIALVSAFILFTAANSLMTKYYVLDPLNTLTNSVSKTGGDPGLILNSERDDEIGVLANAIKEMLGSINDAHQRARLMLDATPLCCVMWDDELNIIECNEEAVSLFRFRDKQEFIERYYEVHAEYQPDGRLSSEGIKEYIKQAFDNKDFTFNWTHKLLDGTVIPSEISLVKVNYGGGHVVAGFMRDLREQIKMTGDIEQRDKILSAVNKATTLLLQAETADFEAVLWESLGIMSKAVDSDRMRLWKNHYIDDKLYCTQLYEWSEGAEPQHGKKHTVDVPYAEDLPGWEEKLTSGQCINSMVRDLSEKEQKRLTPQGILSILIVPVYIRDEFWGFVGFNDCHAERLFTANEESILRSGSLLIANALQRNEMTQQLAAALEKAQAASEAKSSFLSNMSHEIRTPMNAVIGMTSIGKAAADLERKDYAFEKIEGASTHLLGIINDVLDVSKIEANKFELYNVEFNFEKTMHRVVDVINFRVEEKKQKLGMNIDPSIPQTLIGDDQRLAQVVTNLLSNAVKFTPEQGFISLEARVLQQEGDSFTLQIRVSDSGIGISPEQQEILFNSFEQAESSISRRFGGTGLGLTISKHIAELMGGGIAVESALGEGATFIFTFKVLRGSSGSLLLADDISRKDISLLVVDDDVHTLEYFSLLVGQLGLSCDTAESGSEALSLFDKGSTYDMCFLDWRMPFMDGLELSRRIRAGGAVDSVIIMISAFDWNSIEREARESGVNGFLSKPLFVSELADCINMHTSSNKNTAAENDGGKTGESFDGFCILLAEDVEINREIVLSLLEDTKLAIDCAVNGAEAVRMFSDSPGRYGLIFMDIQMPEMDGLTATKLIRASGAQNAADIPIVAMTANVFREDVDKCIEAGMNEHIGKPIDYDEMIKTLRKYLFK